VKDPKQVLDSWRTDVPSRNIYSNLLRQFDLEYPNPRGNRRKPVTKRHVNHATAALSLCLVTGLSVGISSAFADSEIAPEQAPLDQPAAKAKVQMEQPKADVSDVERNIQDSPSEQTMKPSLPKVTPKADTKESRTGQDLVQDRFPVLDASPQEPKARSEVKMQERPTLQSQNQHKRQELPPKADAPTSAQNSSTAHLAMKEHAQAKHHVSAVQTFSRKEQSEGSHNNSSKPEQEFDSWGGNKQLVAKSSSVKQQQTNRTAEPKTVQGGALPKTAGNDLDGVLLGSAVTLLGSAYALRKSRVEKA
jgi:hypothetical protein